MNANIYIVRRNVNRYIVEFYDTELNKKVELYAKCKFLTIADCIKRARIHAVMQNKDAHIQYQ